MRETFHAALALVTLVGAGVLLAMPAVPAAHAAGSKPAAAKPAKPGKPGDGPTVDTTAIQAKLEGADPAAAADGLAAARAAGSAAAPLAPAIEGLLRRGANVAVAKAAIEALGAIGAPSSSAVLRSYVRHRLPDLRHAAIKALNATKGPEAVAAFREGLRSGDARVRGYAATGLGALGAQEAMADLFAALDRDVTEAAAAIGQLCAPADCQKFTAKLGKLPFDVMRTGFDAILLRAKPLPDEALLELVGRLRELGTPEAGRYLAEVQGQWPPTGSKRVKQAIDGAVSSIPGAQGGK